MADTYRIFCDYIKKNSILEEADKIIIGVSGGADSMCLLILLQRLAKEMQLKLTAVHVNHQLRGEEADADEEYVKSFCKKQGIPCVGVRAAVKDYAESHGLSIEEAGRTARYQTFLQVAKKIADTDVIPKNIKVAVAHHRDDNAETILMNLVRGTGLKGLQGMQPTAERFGLNIIRPMLCLGRTEIESYLKDAEVEFRTDSTNLKDEYARNKVRLNIIPQLNEVNSKAAEHINETAQFIIQAQEFIEQEAKTACTIIVDKRDNGLYIDLERFGKLSRVVKAQVIRNVIEQLAGSLKDVGRVHIENVLELEEKQTGRMVELPYGLNAGRSYGNIIIKQETEKEKAEREAAAKGEIGEIPVAAANEPEAFMIDVTQLTTEPTRYRLWGGMEIECCLVPVDPVTRQYLTANVQHTKAFDYSKIKGNIIIRRPEAGDEIQFFGGRKTVRKYFIDEKIPQEERRRALVLSDEHRVMWIIGYRISESYKINEMTNLALQVRIYGGVYE